MVPLFSPILLTIKTALSIFSLICTIIHLIWWIMTSFSQIWLSFLMTCKMICSMIFPFVNLYFLSMLPLPLGQMDSLVFFVTLRASFEGRLPKLLMHLKGPKILYVYIYSQRYHFPIILKIICSYMFFI